MKDQELRRKENNEYIKSNGIDCFENLPLVESSEQVKLKTTDEIAKKAIATLLVIQLACDANNGEYENSVEFISKLIDEYGVKEYLNEKEKRIMDGTYSNQDVLDVTWSYETYWSLVWALGLIDDIKDASRICDCDKAIDLVKSSKNAEEFIGKCKLRDIEDILDMLDLFYRFNWATNNTKIDPNTKIGDLNWEVVVERRKGLEWLVSEEQDWNKISLDT